jgi:hypothetical protein
MKMAFMNQSRRNIVVFWCGEFSDNVSFTALLAEIVKAKPKTRTSDFAGIGEVRAYQP